MSIVNNKTNKCAPCELKRRKLKGKRVALGMKIIQKYGAIWQTSIINFLSALDYLLFSEKSLKRNRPVSFRQTNNTGNVNFNSVDFQIGHFSFKIPSSL